MTFFSLKIFAGFHFMFRQGSVSHFRLSLWILCELFWHCVEFCKPEMKLWKKFELQMIAVQTSNPFDTPIYRATTMDELIGGVDVPLTDVEESLLFQRGLKEVNIFNYSFIYHIFVQQICADNFLFPLILKTKFFVIKVSPVCISFACK